MDVRPRRKSVAKAELLSEILRSVRKLRQKRAPEVAAAMGLRPRTYEHFEAGQGRLNIDRIHAFAELVGADPYAIVTALAISSPQFAVRTANNKLITMFLIALQGFDEQVGDAIANLDAYALTDAFTEMFDKLATTASAPDGMIQRWRGDGLTEDPEDEG